MRATGFDTPDCILPFDTAVLSRRKSSGRRARWRPNEEAVQDIERRHREFVGISAGKK